MFFDQLLLAARKVLLVYFDPLLCAAHYIPFISNHNKVNVKLFSKNFVFWKPTKRNLLLLALATGNKR